MKELEAKNAAIAELEAMEAKWKEEALRRQEEVEVSLNRDYKRVQDMFLTRFMTAAGRLAGKLMKYSKNNCTVSLDRLIFDPDPPYPLFTLSNPRSFLLPFDLLHFPGGSKKK